MTSTINAAPQANSNAARPQASEAFTGDFDVMDTLPKEVKKLTPGMRGSLIAELEANYPKRYEITEAARTLTELLVQLGDATILDKVHITLKAQPEGLGALIIVSYARKDPGARKFFYASRFIADGENAYRALLLQRPKMVKRAIASAKRTIRAKAH